MDKNAYANASADDLRHQALGLIERVLCSEAKVDYSRLRQGNIIESDFRDLIAAADRISNSPLFIDDTAAPSILEIRARARRWRDDKRIFPAKKSDRRGCAR